jgi:hypothetical protein
MYSGKIAVPPGGGGIGIIIIIINTKVKMWRRDAGNYFDKHCTIT